MLKDSGSLYLHCDPTASHYLKLLLDYVFGKNNFRNEIVWHYQTGGASKRHYSKKHDVVFFYSKSENYHIDFSNVRMPRTEKSLARAQNPKGARIAAEDIDKIPTDVFVDIQALNPMAKERTGYPTQKPLALLNRIIAASSNEGDVVMDPFCGCATTCVAAQNLGRNWIGIDVSDVAVNLISERLNYTGDAKNLFTDFDAISTLPARTDRKELDWDNKKARQHFFKTQKGKCNGCGVQFPDPRHFHVDHIYPKSKGGAMVLENLQLLCGSCNSIKGDRPMEYLNDVLKRRKAKIQMY